MFKRAVKVFMAYRLLKYMLGIVRVLPNEENDEAKFNLQASAAGKGAADAVNQMFKNLK